MSKIDSSKNLKSVKIDTDLNKVHVSFSETIVLEPLPGEDANREYVIPHKASPPIRPHKDLIDCLKKLRKPAIDHLGINLADPAKDIKEFTVLSIKIIGSVDLKQSRVKIGLSKKVDHLNEVVDLDVPWFTMYPSEEEKAKYPNAEKVAPIVEDIVEEVWSYLFNGKFDDSQGMDLKQLALFSNKELQEA